MDPYPQRPEEPPPMGAEGSPPPTRRLGVLGRALIMAGGVAVLAAISALGIALFLLRGTGEVLTRMVPADAAVYGTVYLDPALSQKMAIRDLVRKFPAVAKDADLNKKVDEFFEKAFADSGLSFTRDVRPWLGSQIAIVVRMSDGGAQFAVLVASKDDAKAKAALAKLRTGSAVSGDTWTEEIHGGIAVSKGQSQSHIGSTDAYAYVDHTAVLGDDSALIDRIIDADQGKISSLDSSESYTQAIQPLPKERLALLYLNAPALIQRFRRSIEGSGGFDFTQSATALNQLDAYRGVGLAVSARSDGLATDVNITVDRSKLGDLQKQAVTAPPHQNSVLTWTPRSDYAFLASTGFRQVVQSAVDQMSNGKPDILNKTRDLGLTGPGGVISHLTGDMGVEVGPGHTSSFPAGAWLVGTDDPAGMQRFLDKASDMVARGFAGSFASGRPRPLLQWHREIYRGVTIASMALPDLPQQGVRLSYAVSDDVAIVASSPDEVRSVLDAHAGGTTIGSAPTYDAAIQEGLSPNSQQLYLDVQAIAGAIRDALPPEGQQQYEASVSPNLAPVKAFIETSRGSLNNVTIRMFVLIT